MTGLQSRIEAFTELGSIMAEAASPRPSSSTARGLKQVMNRQEEHNKWFTPDNVCLAVRSISELLKKEKLETWLQPYDLNEKSRENTVAVIMAGNIPLVGFHDFLTVLITGNRLMARTSSKDPELIKKLTEILTHIEKNFEKNIIFTDRISGNFDAVIATGSNNTSRYFEYYFSGKPHIFRNNRNSMAIISRDTGKDDLKALSHDIFSYFGLGCRNVSKIFIEKGIALSDIYSQWSDWQVITKHPSYAGNYLYNKSLFNINKKQYTDTGFILLSRDESITAPVSVIYYDYFTDRDVLDRELNFNADSIQCIVSNAGTPYGKSQYPELHEYADNMDTVELLRSL